METIKHSEIKTIEVHPTQKTTALAAAHYIVHFVKNNPHATITYFTGVTPIPIYQEIARQVFKKGVNFRHTKAFHLDEYYPCSPQKPFSFVGYLQERVFIPFGIQKENTFPMNGLAPHAEKEADRYNDLVLQHPSDLMLLGIGPGSHIGFNESGASFESKTHLSNLSSETITRDQKRFGPDVPHQALTQGIKNILSAKTILLTVYGKERGEYLKPALWEKIDPRYPASALRLVGHKVTLLIDQEAAHIIQNRP